MFSFCSFLCLVKRIHTVRLKYRADFEYRKPKPTSYSPIRLLSQFQTAVKPKLNSLGTLDTIENRLMLQVYLQIWSLREKALTTRTFSHNRCMIILTLFLSGRPLTGSWRYHVSVWSISWANRALFTKTLQLNYNPDLPVGTVTVHL